MHIYKRDDRISVWIQAALGLAGLAITALAVVAFSRADNTPAPAQSTTIPKATSPVPRVRTAQLDAERLAQIADLRRQRDEQLRAAAKAAELRMRSKCIDGTLFAEVDGALTNVGTCSKRNY